MTCVKSFRRHALTAARQRADALLDELGLTSCADVIVGTSPLGGIGASISDAAAADIIEKCVRAGFRDFDTAPLYGLGKAEERLGEGLRRSGKAAQCRVWTKVGRLIRTTENVPDPDDIEEENVPGKGIYVDSPKDARRLVAAGAGARSGASQPTCASCGRGRSP